MSKNTYGMKHLEALDARRKREACQNKGETEEHNEKVAI